MNDKNRYEPVYIDGKPFAVRLLTGGDPVAHDSDNNEFDFLLECLGEDKSAIRSENMFSWCQEPVNDTQCRLVCGSDPANFRCYGIAAKEYDCVGYRPVLVPLDPETLQPSPCSHLGEGNSLVIGTLYMNGEAQTVPRNPTPDGDIPDFVSDSDLCIGDSNCDPDKQITWIKSGDILVADRNLLKNISWDDLDRNGLAFGKAKQRTLDAVLKDAVNQSNAQSEQQKATGSKEHEAPATGR